MSVQVVRNRGQYTRKRVYVNLPIATKASGYRVYLGDDGRAFVGLADSARHGGVALAESIALAEPFMAVGVLLGELVKSNLRPELAVLYGSSVGGEFKGGRSDVDLLLAFKAMDVAKAKKLVKPLVSLDVSIVSMEYLAKRDVGPLIALAMRHGVPIVQSTQAPDSASTSRDRLTLFLKDNVDLYNADVKLLDTASSIDDYRCVNYLMMMRLRSAFSVLAILDGYPPTIRTLRSQLMKLCGYPGRSFDHMYESYRLEKLRLPNPIRLKKEEVSRFAQAIGRFIANVMARVKSTA